MNKKLQSRALKLRLVIGVLLLLGGNEASGQTTVNQAQTFDLASVWPAGIFSYTMLPSGSNLGLSVNIVGTDFSSGFGTTPRAVHAGDPLDVSPCYNSTFLYPGIEITHDAPTLGTLSTTTFAWGKEVTGLNFRIGDLTGSGNAFFGGGYNDKVVVTGYTCDGTVVMPVITAEYGTPIISGNTASSSQIGAFQNNCNYVYAYGSGPVAHGVKIDFPTPVKSVSVEYRSDGPGGFGNPPGELIYIENPKITGYKCTLVGSVVSTSPASCIPTGGATVTAGNAAGLTGGCATSSAFEYSNDNTNWSSTPSVTGLPAGAANVYIRDAEAASCGVTLPITVPGPVPCIGISGNFWNNGNGNNLIDGAETITSSGHPFYAILTLGGKVVATTPVNANGTYSFPGAPENTPGLAILASATSLPIGSSYTTSNAGTDVALIGAQQGTNNTATGLGAGYVNITTGTTAITDVNLGYDFRPVPAVVSAPARLNPGATNTSTIAPSLFTGTDADGTVAQLHFTTFPTNTITAIIGGNSYTAATWPAGGITVPVGTTVALDPDGVGEVTPVITYRNIDNAGVESATDGKVTVPFLDLYISGTVYDDANGMTDDAVNGNPTNLFNGTYLYASLVGPDGNVIISIPVLADGAYQFNNAKGTIPNTTYTVVLSPAQGTVGATPPATTVSAQVVNTGEGVTAAGDGTANGTTTVVLGTSDIKTVNFGLDILPVPDAAKTLASQTNPGQTNSILLSSTTFTGTDADGTIAQIHYTIFPTNTISVTIGTTTYTSGNWPVGGVTAAVNAPYRIDPVNGAVTPVITYTVLDNAGKESTTASTVDVPFTDFQLSGTVYDDYNDMTDNTVAYVPSGLIGTNTIYVSLVDPATNKVVGSVPATGGSYTFNTTTGLAVNTSYKVVVSNTAGVVGANASSTP